MAASVKIEFDDGSRIISQTLEDAAGMMSATSGGGSAFSGGSRPSTSSIDEFYEIPKTVAFIANGNFRRVALQFPDPLLREAPEVLWTLQARLRKMTGADAQPSAKDHTLQSKIEGQPMATAQAAAPFIFITGDTSYGSCCVDEVSAQHLKADAIVHYGRACLSPTNSSVPVLYVFGRGELDLKHLASTLLSGPLSPASPADVVEPSGISRTSKTRAGVADTGSKPPVLLLYDVTFAYAIPELLETLADFGFATDGRLVVGLPTPEAYKPMSDAKAGECKRASSPSTPSCSQDQRLHPTCRSGQRASMKDTVNSSGEQCCRASGDDKTLLDGDDGAPGRTNTSPREEKGTKTACPRPAACCSGDEDKGYLASSRSQAEGISVVNRPEQPPANATDALPPCSTERADGPLIEFADAAERGATVAVSVTPTTELAGVVASPSPRLKEKNRLRIGGLGVELDSEEELQRHTLVFVGGEGRQLSNILMRCAGCVDRVRYDPSLPAGERVIADTRKGNKDLMRRYYLVQRAREAGVIGIVVGTLGVQRYSSVVRSLRKMIEDAGRKAYTLAVGKINVAKLANFAEVEVFCLVACAENSLLDSKEFHAPVVTPFELEVALGKRDWDGFYSTDFDDLVGVGSQNSPPKRRPGSDVNIESLTLSDSADSGRTQKADADESAGGDDEPFFSLVSGTYKSRPGFTVKPKGGGDGGSSVKNEGSEGGALVGVGDRSLVEWSSPAADFLGKREFQGLEALVGQTEAKAATEGQSGIASDYGGV